MVDFLKLIKKHEFFSKSMPSYLRTHPGTEDRIFYLDSLIRIRYRQHGVKNIIGNFSRMQALIALDMDDLNVRKKQLEDSLKQDPSNVDLLYALALTEDQQGHNDSALLHLKAALKSAPQDEDVLTNIGLIYLKMGQPDQALIYLLKVENLYPPGDEIIMALGKTYFALGNFQKSLEYYLQVKDKTIQNVDVNYQIAMAYGQLNNQGESHYFFGLHFKKARKKESSLYHFKEALKYYPQTSGRAEAINKEIKELTDSPPRKFNTRTKR
jgi:predicted Zn-dependent protease